MTNPKILIVDDEPDTIKLLALRLNKNGYEVIACGTGKEALEAVKKELPALAILDIKLPDMTGYDILKHFRQTLSLCRMPVIFSTADASVALKKTAKEYDADDYVIKPYDARDLILKIQTLLASSPNRHEAPGYPGEI